MSALQKKLSYVPHIILSRKVPGTFQIFKMDRPWNFGWPFALVYDVLKEFTLSVLFLPLLYVHYTNTVCSNTSPR